MVQGKKVAITLHDSILKWIDAEVEKGRYYNRSHAVTALVRDQQRRDTRTKKKEEE